MSRRRVGGQVPYSSGSGELLLSRGERGYATPDGVVGSTYLAPVFMRALIWFLAIGATVSGLVIASVAIHKLRPNGSFTNNAIETTMLNVTVKANFTDLEADRGYFSQLWSSLAYLTSLVSENVTTDNLDVTNGNIDSLTTNMETHGVYAHTASGAVVSTHNVQTIESASDVVLTVGTSDVGKRFRICSLGGGGVHRLDVSPLRWDTPNGYWAVIQFDDGVSGCCVEYEVLSATEISLLSRGDRCTVFCNRHSPGAGEHCVDPERPTETNAFHGVWRQLDRNGEIFDVAEGIPDVMYYIIDMSTWPGRLTIAQGSLQNILYEPIDRTINVFGEKPDEFSFFGWAQGDYDTSDQWWDFGMYAKLQSDGRHMATFQSYSGSYPTFITITNYFEKIEKLPPVISTFPEVPYESSRQIMRFIADTAVNSFNPHMNHVEEMPYVMDRREAYALLNEIIEDGVTETNDIVQVLPTRDPAKFALTKLRLRNRHYVASPATVTVSGFTGAWAALNGNHVVNRAFTNNIYTGNGNTYQDWNDASVENRTIHQHVSIYFDSSALPVDVTTGYANFTGTPQVSVTYGPITDNSELAPTLSSLAYWITRVFEVGQHIRLRMWHSLVDTEGLSDLITVYPISTWGQLQTLFATIDVADPDMRTRLTDVASIFYTNPLRQARSDGILDYNDVWTFDVANDRYGLLADSTFSTSDQWWHLIPKNYLQDIRIPVYRCTGGAKPDFLNFIVGLIYGWGGECDYFEGDVAEPGADLGSDFVPFHADLGYNDPRSAYGPAGQAKWDETTFVARVNTSYTGGKNIGYLRFADTIFADPFGAAAVGQFFAPPAELVGSAPNRAAMRRVLAPMMHYLVTVLDVEDVIIDIRANAGGFAFTTMALREFFGTETQRILRRPSQSLRNSDFNNFDNTITTESLDDAFGHFNGLDAYHSVYPDEVETLFPGSVFRGGEVLIITDIESSSGGDFFVNTFLGENLDRSLGPQVTTKIFGDVDGRLGGCTGNRVGSPISRVAPFLYDTDSNRAVSPTGLISERCMTPTRSDGSSMARQVPALAPDCLPDLRGKSGSCALPNDVETILYSDLGLEPNTRPRLTGDPRPQQPVPTEKDSLRDTWLESVIRYAVSTPAVAPPTFTPVVFAKNIAASKSQANAFACSQTSYSTEQLTPLMQAPRSTNVTIAYDPMIPNHLHAMSHPTAEELRKEFAKHGICFDDDTGHPMVTPACQYLPNIAIRSNAL